MRASRTYVLITSAVYLRCLIRTYWDSSGTHVVSRATKTPDYRGCLERMMGLEPTTFRMASAGSIRARSHECAKAPRFHLLRGPSDADRPRCARRGSATCEWLGSTSQEGCG